jgi:pimeloyl-ACP methyl ester carboxylesterase
MAEAARRRPRILLLALLVAVAALLSTAVSSGVASAATVGSTGAAVNPSPGPFPPGTNTCAPTRVHPYPVVLVHGTFENALQNWAAMAPYLQSQGYCVYALNYGLHLGLFGTGDIPTSARQLAAFVSFVRTRTGAAKVDIVGHSQGGMMPRYYINELGGARYVDKLIGLSPSNHGTTNPAAAVAVTCPACLQQVYGSPFITGLNSSGETRSGVFYTVLETKLDEVVTPYTSAFLNGPSSRVTNVTLQDKCPTDVDDHLATPFDPVVFQWVSNALARRPGEPGVHAGLRLTLPPDRRRHPNRPDQPVGAGQALV